MHTPGPWELCDGGNSIVVAGGPNNDDIADFSYSEEHTVSISRQEALANARLFIAAPGMLLLLGRLLILLSDHAREAGPLLHEYRAICAILGDPVP